MKGCFLGTKPSPDNFGKWAKKRDIFLHPDVAFLVPTKTMGAGVFARRALPAGTVVVSCPLSSSICPYTVPSVQAPSEAYLQGLRSGTETLTSPIPATTTATSSSSSSSPSTSLPEATAAAMTRIQTDNVLYAVLRLTAELGRKTTPYRPWLEACPRMDEHLFALTAAQKAALGVRTSSDDDKADTDAPMTWTGISQQLRDVQLEARWQAAQRVMSSRPDLWPASVATRAMFNQCLAQVLSRNFHREEIQSREGPYLLPGLDILNHSFAANATFDLRGGGRKHEACFTVVTTRPLAVAEQVYVSYGRIGAARFAVEFQFTTTSVLQRDLVRFSTETIVALAIAVRRRKTTTPSTDTETTAGASAALRDDLVNRVERLQRLGILFDEGFYLTCATHDQLDDAADAATLTPAGDGSASASTLHPAEPPAVQHSKDRSAAEDALLEEAERNLLTACVVLYALMLPKEAFVDLYHGITRDWVPPFLHFEAEGNAAVKARGLTDTESTAAQFVWDALEARREAASEQMARVRASFVEVRDEEGNVKEQATRHALNRRRLLEAVLGSEVAVVAFYQRLLCRFSGLDVPSTP